MKILFVMNYDVEYDFELWKNKGITDCQTHLLWGITHLDQYGIDVDVLSFKKNYFLHRIGFLLGLGDLDQQLRIFLKQSQYDLVYSASPTSTVVLSILRTLGIIKVPLIVRLDRPFGLNFLSQFFVRWYLMGHHKIICLSTRIQNQLRDELKIPESRLPLLRWGPDLAFYNRFTNSLALKQPAVSISASHTYSQSPLQHTGDLQISQERQISTQLKAAAPIIMSAGGTSRDFDTLIRSIENISCSLKIFCTGRSAPDFKSTSGKVQVAYGHSTEKTAVPVQALIAEYEKAYAIAIPLSIPHHRQDTTTLIGLTSLLEAMAMGKAVIMTKHRQANIDIEKEGIGLWVEPEDVQGWESAISYLIQHPEETKNMGLRARQLCESKYNLDEFSRDLAQTLADFKDLTVPD